MKTSLLLLTVCAALGCGGSKPKPASPPVVVDHRDPPKPPPEEPKPIQAEVSGAQLDVPGEIEFDLDKASLKKDDATESTLNGILKILKENPSITKIRVEGHTDSDGGDKLNQKLSNDRAKTVVKWLVAKGIDEKRVISVGCAAKDPLVPNTSAENKSKNRRTEFDIEEIDGKQPPDYTSPCAPNPKRKPL